MKNVILADITADQSSAQDLIMLASHYRLVTVDTKWFIYSVPSNTLMAEGARSSLHIGLRRFITYQSRKEALQNG